MEFGKSGYVVLPEGRSLTRGGQSRAEKLRRWLVECPRCSGVWLVVGAREGDAYLCKGCGHAFTIRFTVARRGNPPGSAASGSR
jgi:hypothetical protein